MSDPWLLGFAWENVCYTDYYTPFGLRTGHLLFDLVRKVDNGHHRTAGLQHYPALGRFPRCLLPGNDPRVFNESFNRFYGEIDLRVNFKQDL